VLRQGRHPSLASLRCVRARKRGWCCWSVWCVIRWVFFFRIGGGDGWLVLGQAKSQTLRGLQRVGLRFVTKLVNYMLAKGSGELF
jgi:hypothetical protein